MPGKDTSKGKEKPPTRPIGATDNSPNARVCDFDSLVDAFKSQVQQMEAQGGSAKGLEGLDALEVIRPTTLQQADKR